MLDSHWHAQILRLQSQQEKQRGHIVKLETEMKSVLQYQVTQTKLLISIIIGIVLQALTVATAVLIFIANKGFHL